MPTPATEVESVAAAACVRGGWSSAVTAAAGAAAAPAVSRNQATLAAWRICAIVSLTVVTLAIGYSLGQAATWQADDGRRRRDIVLGSTQLRQQEMQPQERRQGLHRMRGRLTPGSSTRSSSELRVGTASGRSKRTKAEHVNVSPENVQQGQDVDWAEELKVVNEKEGREEHGDEEDEEAGSGDREVETARALEGEAREGENQRERTQEKGDEDIIEGKEHGDEEEDEPEDEMEGEGVNQAGVNSSDRHKGDPRASNRKFEGSLHRSGVAKKPEGRKEGMFFRSFVATTQESVEQGKQQQQLLQRRVEDKPPQEGEHEAEQKQMRGPEQENGQEQVQGGRREHKQGQEGEREERQEQWQGREKEPAQAPEQQQQSQGGKGPTACPEECKHTCNLELGRCDCPADWEGPSCTQPSLPRCRHLTGFLTPCETPTTCGCQLDCNRFHLPHEFPCFAEVTRRNDHGGRGGGRPLATINATFIPSQHASLTDFFLTPDRLPEDGLIGALNFLGEPSPMLSRAVPWEHCPGRCNERGSCRQDTACICPAAFAGWQCEERRLFPYTCYSNCSGKGRCEDGVCVCESGHYGIDCSLRMGRHGAPVLWKPPLRPPPPGAVREGERVRPLVYVYELPPHMNQWLHRHKGEIDRTEIFFFFQWLLQSPYRTANGFEADYYFLPIYPRYHHGQGIIEAAVDYIRRTWPFYNATHGHRHMLYLTGDWGACETGSAPWGMRDPLLANFTLLTLWCHKFNMFKGTTRPCFVSGQDVCMPPDQGYYVLGASPLVNGSMLKEAGAEGADARNALDIEQKRPELAFFRGFFSNWDEMGPPAGFDEPMKPYILSFGFRQRIFDLFVNFTHLREGEERPNLEGVSLVKTTGVPSGYLQEALNATFCLSPAGFGWAMRTTQAILLGCIPVILQDDVDQPFGDELIDWDGIAVRVHYDQLPRLFDILRAIPHEEIVAKREAGRRVWTRFVHPVNEEHKLDPQPPLEWNERLGGEDAYESLMEVLRRRLGRTERRRRGGRNG